LAISIRITGIRLSGGDGHEHITHVWWTNQATGEEGNSARGQLIQWIETANGRAYLDDDHGNYTAVLVVTPRHGEKYLQTCADGKLTDNLLALPHK
jgi:Protein of unknown function (DUF3892)